MVARVAGPNKTGTLGVPPSRAAGAGARLAFHPDCGLPSSAMTAERSAPPTGDRRPIAARGLAPSIWLADLLVRAGASANAISIGGVAAGTLAGICFGLVGSWTNLAWLLWLLGAVLVQLRLLANMLDGMVAVGRGIASPVGELFNEVPDRVSDTRDPDRLRVGGRRRLGLGLAGGARGDGDGLCPRRWARRRARQRFLRADGEAAAHGAGDGARRVVRRRAHGWGTRSPVPVVGAGGDHRRAPVTARAGSGASRAALRRRA